MTPADAVILGIMAITIAAVLIKLHKRKQNGSCSGCRGCSRGQQSGSEPDDQNGPTHT